MPDMRCVIYVSSAVHLPTEQEMDNLVFKARIRNAEMGVTGILLYKERSFMQYIEGPLDGLEQIYSIIKTDQLHTGIIEMLNEPILIRQFPEWSMACQQGQFRSYSRPKDYSDYLALKLDCSNSNESNTRLLLNQFWNS